jgi:hypothetical protein
VEGFPGFRPASIAGDGGDVLVRGHPCARLDPARSARIIDDVLSFPTAKARRTRCSRVFNARVLEHPSRTLSPGRRQWRFDGYGKAAFLSARVALTGTPAVSRWDTRSTPISITGRRARVVPCTGQWSGAVQEPRAPPPRSVDMSATFIAAISPGAGRFRSHPTGAGCVGRHRRARRAPAEVVRLARRLPVVRDSGAPCDSRSGTRPPDHVFLYDRDQPAEDFVSSRAR